MKAFQRRVGQGFGLAGQAVALQELGHHLAREVPPPAEAPEAQLDLGWGLLS